MPHNGFDLAASARLEMIHEGFDPDFPPEAAQEVAAIRSNGLPAASPAVRDLRDLLWSSIDNDTSRDLDQIEVAMEAPEGIRVLVGIADVDCRVETGSAIDRHAESQTTTVYTAVRVFPMLPEELSTDLTSLNENDDRAAVVIEMVVARDGSIASSDVYRALVRNNAQLTYESVGPWLEGTRPAPAKVAGTPGLEEQIKLQDTAATALRQRRHELGALDFDRVEVKPLVSNGEVQGLEARRKNRASALIEDFMIAANESMARTLTGAGVSSIRRVVKSPERWPRIADLAAQHGATLPADPDPAALAQFLAEQRRKDPLRYADLSLAVVKLMGPGEYVMLKPGEESPGHFGLATHDYTHSTAPNRRFADLVTQRLVKSALDREAPRYTGSYLDEIARNCTLKEDAARKVERKTNKRVAAVALSGRVGETFSGVVTGVSPKGVFVRVLNPPIEGRLVEGEHGADVGDRIRVTLLSTDAERGYIDFGRS